MHAMRSVFSPAFLRLNESYENTAHSMLYTFVMSASFYNNSLVAYNAMHNIFTDVAAYVVTGAAALPLLSRLFEKANALMGVPDVRTRQMAR